VSWIGSESDYVRTSAINSGGKEQRKQRRSFSTLSQPHREEEEEGGGGSVSSRTRSSRPARAKDRKAASLIRIPRNAKIRLGHAHPPGAFELSSRDPPLFQRPSTKRAGNFVRKRQSCACMEIMELMMMRSMELEMGIDRERPA
jgi:hypothetical protein